MLISVFQAKEMLASSGEFYVSLDLGLSRSKVVRSEDVFKFQDGQAISAAQLKKLLKKDQICFFIEQNDLVPASIFSQDTNNYYKLVPTGLDTPPTIEISGIRMHVTKGISPREDTLQKTSLVQPVEGDVLDTCTGLGYTAIECAKTAASVLTVEKDRNVIEMQNANPWSEGLSAKNIKRLCGDVFQEVKKFKRDSFDVIVHDPPRLNLAPLLYSQIFYDELYRVARKGCRIYHYTGQPGSKNRGIDLQKNVMERLKKSGFQSSARVFNGVSCRK